MTGTLVNTAAIVAGSLIGIMVRKRLPRRFADLMFQCIGLLTLALGIPMCAGPGNFLFALVSLVAGSLLGQWVRIGERMDKFTRSLHRRARGEDCGQPADEGAGRFTEGFLTASLLFCAGSMAILGAIEDGTGQFPRLLYTKSIMDGVSSVILASTFGAAILLSAVPVLLYQGAITALAWYGARFMTEGMIADLTLTGGILLIALGLNILKITRIEVLDMLPSLVFVIILSALCG